MSTIFFETWSSLSETAASLGETRPPINPLPSRSASLCDLSCAPASVSLKFLIVKISRSVPLANSSRRIEQSFSLAKEQYAELGVDVERALFRLNKISISLHCWQGDDVGGFENTGSELGGGLAVTGNYPGRARTPEELRADFEKAISLLPGRHRLNLHACYLDSGGRRVERNQLESRTFKAGSIGPVNTTWGWISIRRFLRIQKRPMDSRWRIPMPAFASFGSSTASPAAKSARRWARRSARRA